MPGNNNHNNQDPIEHLFRKKVEEYDISFREEDWIKLEKQLDQQDQKDAARKKQWLIAAAVFLLFSVLGYAVFQNYQEIKSINDQISNQENAISPQQENREGAPDRKERTSDDTRAEDYTDSRTDPGSQDAGANQIVEEESRQAADNREETTLKQPVTGDNEIAQKSGLPHSTVPRLSADDLPCAVCGLLNLPDDPNESAGRELARAKIPDQRVTGRQQKAPPPGFTGRHETQQDVDASRVFVGVSGGPDLSTVGSFSDFHHPGYNLGLLFEYKLNSSFSIRTGLMRASVYYVADGSEYRPPAGFWSYETVPEQTTAQCIILDIPVSLKFDFWHFSHSRLYGTAGLSSYIMLSEDYKFNYGYQNTDHNRVQGWSGKTGTRHWMSNASLSLGYTIDLSPQISMQIEPFMKLPINDVGWGRVKLYSMGTIFSLNYKLY